MNRIKLFNLSHEFSAPAAEDKPIFLPFGTWAYDGKISQTFTREAAARIANELAADVAAGNPGIPVYQGHPDVPNLAAKYPDKGALGWVKKIDLSNEGCTLTVEWDRFPGKGFGWFSPYWFGEKTGLDNQGKTLVAVDHIASIGLVNNPNISEFRLPNEAVEKSERQKLIDELAAKFDKAKLANVTDANGASHGEDGKFDGGNGGTASPTSNAKPSTRKAAKGGKSTPGKPAKDDFNGRLKDAIARKDRSAIAQIHMDALKAGMVWHNKKFLTKEESKARISAALKRYRESLSKK